jgi:hypothetical protein
MKLLLFLSIAIILEQARALECPPGQYIISAHSRDSYYRNDGTFVSASKVEAYCRRHNFLSPLKLTFLSKMPDGWPNQLELFKNWTPLEKKEVEKSFNSLPKILKNLGEVKLYRAVKSSFPNNQSTSGPDVSIIVLYDSAKQFGYRQALAHEIGHILFSKLSKDEKEDYLSVARWRFTKGYFETSRKSFSEPDGVLSPEEDFANNVEHAVGKHDLTDEQISKYLRSLLGIKKK